MKAVIFTIILFSASVELGWSQTNWHPIPLGQTSFFKVGATNEVVPMKCDSVDAFNSNFQIYGAALNSEYGNCAGGVWWLSNRMARADFKGFSWTGDTLVIQGVEAHFTLPLNMNVNDTTELGSGLVVEYNSQDFVSLLGAVSDSVKSFTVYADSSGELVGTIELSKNHGFKSFISIANIEMNVNEIQQWTLAGLDDGVTSIGFSVPVKNDFLPYVLGDEIAFIKKYYEDYTAPQSSDYYVFSVDSFHNSYGVAKLFGKAFVYDEQGFAKDTLPEFSLDFGSALQGADDYPIGVPHNDGNRVSVPSWCQESLDAVRLNVQLSIQNFCDSSFIIDAPFEYYLYDTRYGLIEKYENPGWGPDTRWTLYAAKAENFNYGEWPEWLGVGKRFENTSFGVYPNPTSEFLIIKGDFAGDIGTKLYSTDGRIVMQMNLEKGDHVDVSSLKPGSYFLVLNESGQSFKLVLTGD